jgi:inner membrane protein
MDNVCHALVGAACGAAGLNRRTRYGAAALMISANLPDVDVLVWATDTPWIEFRRGWTHGIAAQLLLPVVLTGALMLLDRFRRARGSHGDHAFHAGWMLVLSYVGVYTHVFLDFLNNYGVRLLTPVSWRWFYGDAVFIVDPWMWIVLGAGVWMAGSRGGPRPARVALALATGYIVVMLTSGWAARSVVATAWTEMHGVEPRALMVGPVPLSPFTRQVIVDAGDHYETGTFSWLGVSATFDPERIPKNDNGGAVAAARADTNVRAFLVWARFPFWTMEPAPQGTKVTVSDVRFAGASGFRASTIVH